MAQVLSPGAIPDEPMAPKEQEWHENLNVRLTCRECREDPPNLFEDHASGDLVCATCGLVLQERSIDQSSEWRTFSNDDQGNDDPSRVGDGPNALLNGAQLNTMIAYGDGMKSKELHRAQNRANLDKGNKALLAAYKQIGALCDGWQLPPSVSDTCKHLYKTADESKLFKGKSNDALIAGCLFLACRRCHFDRSFREVMELTRVSKKEIGRVFKTLEALLLRADKEREGQTSMVGGGQVVYNDKYEGSSSASPADLSDRYCNMLDFDMKASIVSRLLAEKVYSTAILAGRSPLSQVAACIYMTSHAMSQPKSAKDISDVVKVSDSTIRQAYKLLYNQLDSILTEDITARGADVSKLPKPN